MAACITLPSSTHFCLQYFFQYRRARPVHDAEGRNSWRWSGYISMPHFRTFLFHAFSLKCRETPISLSSWATRGPKPWQYRSRSNHLWKWSGYINMPLLRPFHMVSSECQKLISFSCSFLGGWGHQRAKPGPTLTKSNHFWSKHTSACHSFGHFLHAFFLECPEIRIIAVFLATRGTKLNQYWPKLNHFWMWSRYY